MSDPSLPAVSPANNLRGIFWMFVFTVCMSCMWVAIRHVSAGVHPFEIAFFRNLFGLIAVVPWFVRFGFGPLQTRRLGLLTWRGVVNTVSMLAFFTALSLIPVAEVTALAFTAPIYATLFAMVLFRESVGLRRWAAIFVGFAGTIVILRPGFAVIETGHWLIVGSAVLWGACLVMIKVMGRTESSVTVTTYMSLIMTPLSLLPALFYWSWPTPEQWGWLVLIGTLGGAGQLAMTESLKWGETHVVMPVDFIKLVWVSIIGFAFFGELPDVFVWLGGGMVFGATAFIAWREHRLGREERKPDSLT